jgi:hypothetical protein
MAGETVPFWYVFTLDEVPHGYKYEVANMRGKIHYKVFAEGTGPTTTEGQELPAIVRGKEKSQAGT